MPNRSNPTVSSLQRKGEEKGDQYGKAEKGLNVCKVCHNVRIGKKWHHAYDEIIKEKIAEHVGAHFTLCPADEMIKDHKYEGEIIIEGVPEDKEALLVNLITGFAKRAEEMDPQDRLIAIEETGEGALRITTTENQLALKIAKKIEESFKKAVELNISFDKEPYEVARIKLWFV